VNPKDDTFFVQKTLPVWKMRVFYMHLQYHIPLEKGGGNKKKYTKNLFYFKKNTYIYGEFLTAWYLSN
jgi:hypothetical protein